MDTPLLALTRRRGGGLRGRSPREAAADNMRQLIQLRWIAVAGQLVAILTAHFGLGVELPLVPMLVVIAVLLLANSFFLLSLGRRWFVESELLLSLLLDMAALTAQLYLSGGATNPFVSLYLLQVVLGAILLRPWTAALLAAFACLAFTLLATSHRPLQLPRRVGDVPIDLWLVGEWFGFAMVAVLLVLFITRISRNLQARDAYLAELGQRAAEEDGIVRMGLFASGAAHELGTPLSSLSVLVADWLRDDVFSRDPRVRDELMEAQSEVERCKAIVSNILHSAGQTRGEAMEATSILPLLDDIADSWEALHSKELSYRADRLEGAKVAAGPALRQAIWSLLENAREASSTPIELAGEIECEQLVISVRDRGPGFLPEQLQSIGKLRQSTKGPGHGLGLFLISNVVRRLGGTLEAGNRTEGGAAVRIILPLASQNRDVKELDHS
jgi:two-component system sensor histidine kinase RegB